MRKLMSLLLVALAVVSITSCSRSAGSPDTTGGPPATNIFIPEGQNVSDCVGTLERPDCGSSAKGGYQLYLAFAALVIGLGVIGWRITVGVRRREAARPPV